MYYSVSFPATTYLLPITNKGAVQWSLKRCNQQVGNKIEY